MVALIHGIVDDRVAVVATICRFAVAATKSDAREGSDVTAPAKRVRESTRDEDARL